MIRSTLRMPPPRRSGRCLLRKIKITRLVERAASRPQPNRSGSRPMVGESFTQWAEVIAEDGDGLEQSLRHEAAKVGALNLGVSTSQRT